LQGRNERVRLRAKVAAPMSAGQGGRVEKDTARPLAQIEGHLFSDDDSYGHLGRNAAQSGNVRPGSGLAGGRSHLG
jgi:hypothetical protein